MRDNESTWATVTMAIVCLIVVVLVFSMVESAKHPRRRRTKSDQCKANVKQLSLGMMMYLDDYDVLPQHLSQLAEYLGDTTGTYRVFTCPVTDNAKYLTVAEIDERTDYLYRPAIVGSDTVPVLADKISNHHFKPINIVYADQHVEVKDLSHETITLMKETFGDTVITTEQLDFMSQTKLQTVPDSIDKFLEDNAGKLTLLVFFLVTVSLNIAARIAINRYRNEFGKKPTGKELKAWRWIHQSTHALIWTAIIFILLGSLCLPKLSH